MTEPIDIAYVDIVVRDDDLKKLPQDVDKAARKAERNFERELTDKIDDAFGHSLRRMDKDLDTFVDDADKKFTEVDHVAERSFTHIERDVTQHVRGMRRGLRGLADDIGNFGDDVDNRFTRRLRTGLTNLTGLFGTFFARLGEGFSALKNVMPSPLISLIVALVPLIIALSGALVQLIGVVGLIPSGLVVLAATIAPLIIAFQNFGDAVSALASGDLEKIDEALKKLAPSARVVAREVAALLEPLKALQRAVQQAFFTPLIGGFAQLTGVLIPALTIGLSKVAAQLGVVLRRVLDFISLPEQLKFFDDLFGTAQRLVARFGPSLVSFLEGFLEVADRALPVFEKIGNVIIDAFGRFGQFMTDSARSGALDKFIGDALTTLKELGSLLGATIGLFHTLFAGTRDEGHSFINTLTDLIKRLDDFFQSAAGQDVIHNMVIEIKIFTGVLIGLLNTLIFLGRSGRAFVVSLVKIAAAVSRFAHDVGDFFAKIPDAVGKFFSQLPDRIAGFFSAAFDAALVQLGNFIGLVLFSIKNLPDLIINFLATLPGRIADLFDQTRESATSKLKDLFIQAGDLLARGWDELITFIKSVPDRIKDLGPDLLAAGLHLIKAFMNGIRSAGNFIGDVAGDIVRAIKGFLNHVIDKINQGIKQIDDVLPGDLPRIPRLAEGGIIPARPGGTLVVAGEGGEDEVVAPLSKLQAGPSITFGAGAINVNFEGAVPTTQDAHRVGQAVGQGILDILARRDVRAQVRAI